MNRMIRLIAPLLLFVPLAMDASDFLFSDGHSDYSIVLPADASKSETTAAKELQEYLRQISGATLPIVTDPDGGAVGQGRGGNPDGDRRDNRRSGPA